MAKKINKADTPDREKLERAAKAVHDYLQLSSFLFGDDAPYEMNEIKPGNKYYELAKELADEMEVDWNGMSHQDSNRIMLALLDEYFNNIRESNDEFVRVEVKAIKIEKKEVGNEKPGDADAEG